MVAIYISKTKNYTSINSTTSSVKSTILMLIVILAQESVVK